MTIRVFACAAVAVAALAASGCQTADRAAEGPPPTPATSSEPPSALKGLPDTDGPIEAPVDPPYTAAVLTGVHFDTSLPGVDGVTFTFAGKPQCTGMRLQELPAGTPPVQGNAFVQLTCTPAEPRQTPPDEADDMFGDFGARAAALEGRAASDDMVNVIEAVQTSTEGDVVVWTIGLRHSALWGIGNMSAAPGTINAAPMVGIAQ